MPVLLLSSGEDTVCIQTCKRWLPRCNALPGLWTTRSGNWIFIRQRHCL